MKETSEIKKYKAIDFFCGGGGMTCGLRQAGIDVIAEPVPLEDVYQPIKL